MQHILQLVLQQGERHRIHRNHSLGILNEVAQLGISLVTNGLVQRNRLPGVLLDFQHLILGDIHFLRQLIRCGLPAQILQQFPLNPAELINNLHHVHRDTDRSRLIRHGARDRLADPPRRIGGKLIALGVVELLHRTNQPQVALLNQIQKRHAATRVPLR